MGLIKAWVHWPPTNDMINYRHSTPLLRYSIDCQINYCYITLEKEKETNNLLLVSLCYIYSIRKLEASITVSKYLTFYFFCWSLFSPNAFQFVLNSIFCIFAIADVDLSALSI
jgi:hypothetical protein